MKHRVSRKEKELIRKILRLRRDVLVEQARASNVPDADVQTFASLTAAGDIRAMIREAKQYPTRPPISEADKLDVERENRALHRAALPTAPLLVNLDRVLTNSVYIPGSIRPRSLAPLMRQLTTLIDYTEQKPSASQKGSSDGRQHLTFLELRRHEVFRAWKFDGPQPVKWASMLPLAKVWGLTPSKTVLQSFKRSVRRIAHKSDTAGG